ncbi:MAG: DUF58 domain-containing protein [Candidatus Sumerlaeota bacterium]|nr:DUF58 domain-containing protein [Candidatus Sumerlaeota bacterium]
MSDTRASNELMDPDFLRRLERLQLHTRRIFRGGLRGERRSHRKGVSIEFADYRDYARGDDLRHIDWNIYARLERLFLKLFLEEQDLFFYILLDVSQSMDWGAINKLQYGKKVAAALAYIGLTNMDRVGVIGFSAAATQVFNPSSGRHNVWRMLEFLNNLAPNGQTSLRQFCHSFALKYRRRGIVVLISDLLDPAGYDEALKYLLHGGNDVYLLHVLADEEIEPDIRGHLDLIDCETEDRTEVTASPQLLSTYKRTVNAYCTQVKRYAARYAMNYLFTPTSTDFERLILSVLRARGLVK